MRLSVGRTVAKTLSTPLLASALLFLALISTLYADTVLASRVWGPSALLVEVHGTIDEGVRAYIEEALKLAEARNWPLIVYLDTPGGYLDTALSIVDLVDNAHVPVIAYAGGRWAVSAGTLILVSSPLAYAAPRTVIGSMQPVIVTPEGVRPVNSSKIVNTLLKILEVHCEAYGRNFTAVKLFVTQNLNLDGLEAYHYHVIDGVARGIDELVALVNGSRVKLYNGEEGVIILDGSIEEYEMPVRYRIVRLLADPVISSLLLSIGSLILVVSLASGHLVYAPLGLLLILLGLFGLGYNVNTLALLLVILGALLIAIDLAVIPGFGVPGITGTIMLILGLMLLPFGGELLVAREQVELLLYTALGIGAVFAGFSAVTAYKVVRIARSKLVYTPIPLGKKGRALDDIAPDKEGFVFVEGEYWMARSKAGVIKKGEEVVVVGKEGPYLIVEKVESGEASAG